MASDETIGPERLYKVVDERWGSIGYLAIDSTINGRSFGGLRMVQYLTIPEIVYSARTMTLKLAFAGIKVGGAKAGINLDPRASVKTKKAVLLAFGKNLSLILRTGLCDLGVDMGTSSEDVQCVKRGAGLKSNPVNLENKSHVYTGLTMLVSAREAAHDLGLELSECTVAVEGFGNVGSSVAAFFSEAGAKVVAISTIEGAIYNPKGLNVDKLIKIRRETGDSVVKTYSKARKIRKEDLLCLPVDIMVPCARPWSINSSNAHKIRSKIICPGANAAMTQETEEFLFSRKVMCLPDFVANAGGVLWSFTGRFAGEEGVRDIINKQYSRRVLEVIKISRDLNVSLGRVARKIAERRFYYMKLKVEQSKTRNRLLGLAFYVVEKNSVLRALIKPLRYAHAVNTLCSDRC